jgi:plastocyanin
MRHLVSLALVYALVAALVLPGSLLAAEDEVQPAAGDTGAPDPAQEEQDAGRPGAEPESTGEQQPAAEPAPESAPPAPAPPSPAGPAEQQAAAPAQAPAQPAAGERRNKPVARKAQSGSITITDFKFTPASITVDVGDTVTWTNQGRTPHSATAGDGSFDTGTFPRGQSRSHTFDAAGSFSYICTPHPFMKGTVTVRGASTGGGGSSGGSASGSGGEDAGSSGGSSSSSGSGSGAALPESGTDAGALALLGLLLVALGAATRRRAAAQRSAHPGRTGW